jgi:hypothetical protein
MTVHQNTFANTTNSNCDTNSIFGSRVTICSDGGHVEAINLPSKQNDDNEFDATTGHAYLFQPSQNPYTLDKELPVGFYTQVAGLGDRYSNVKIVGNVISHNMGDHATQNFWRSAENFEITPQNGNMTWAVSQASPLRNIKIDGNLTLSEGSGYSSGGFMANITADTVNRGTQQQWFTRSSSLKTWNGSDDNMVFVNNNITNINFSSQGNTLINNIPTMREKPYLAFSESLGYYINVPVLERGLPANSGYHDTKIKAQIAVGDGTCRAGSHVLVVRQDKSNISDIQSCLNNDGSIIFTPGFYNLQDTIYIHNSDSVILGLGIPVLHAPTNGKSIIAIDDNANGTTISGIIAEADKTSQGATLIKIGNQNAKPDDENYNNPTLLSDLYCRIRGNLQSTTNELGNCITINKPYTIGDNLWLWRADHGDDVSWTANPADTGLIINADNVIMYGLAVEHFEKHQVIWNGKNGVLIFFQSEEPYDVPNQEAWMDEKGHNGYSAINVTANGTNFQGYGLGIYFVVKKPFAPNLQSAIEIPEKSEYSNQIHHSMFWILQNTGTFSNMVNDDGFSFEGNDKLYKYFGSDKEIFNIKQQLPPSGISYFRN